ncbi:MULTISPECIES: DUF4178 domain-containing protein [Micromonospora]|uniref:DUF4178 domain-containing protein n=1 Tax=Micromonospora solifontis TaxID=2487138 RepID=A0ABX9WFB3_9ACTN|nr:MULTISPECIES: DUF4178 domain-containing protein [Micromonospora]NES14472.1 DUF4178 domain-containing protein [Micromonospora sp. PPF5-17B]NES38486.1 DUF4178 domain-containing protein [Micromonospora solifontis]NES56403.1 DUF4178 domain-containing protein [Micromonospora sp. PPF5-6]RNL95305.1 DUF4178 domain-containing protein [Micromonospora solifontis]
MNGSVAYLVTTLGCLVGVAGVVIAVIALRRARSGPRPQAPGDPFRDRDADALRGDPRNLKPGDIVEIRQVPYTVRGSVHLVEGGWSWAEHLLDDAGGVKRWLSVETDPDLELVFWTAEPSATVTPGAPTLEIAGRRYQWDESGQARYTATEGTGLDPRGTMRYHDYQAPGGARLSFEAYGEAGWEVNLGETLHRAEVMIYPQAGPGQGS